MKQVHKVIMLPTEKASQIHLWEDEKGKSLHLTNKEDAHTRNCQHLYLLSNEPIQENDWIYDIKYKESGHNKGLIFQKNFKYDSNDVLYKKIIATTDKSLGIEQMKGEPLSTFQLPQFPEAFIQKYVEAYNSGHSITEVNVEYESVYLGTEGDGHSSNSWGVYEDRLKLRPNNTIIISPSRMYSREEVLNILEKYLQYLANPQRKRNLSAKEFFEQNL